MSPEEYDAMNVDPDDTLVLLHDVHEEVRAVLDACDIWYPGGAS